jgi:DNA-binding transcriptional LysR family regulator
MNLASIDLNLLVAFEAMMEERHVTRAADRIGLAQPSMSNALKRLRALFNDELFVRMGGGMQPTDKAISLARPIGLALRQVRVALAPEPAFDARSSQRRFAVAVTDYGDLVVVPKLIHLLRGEAPGIDIAVKPITDARAAVSKLERGEVDVLIGGHLPDSTQCIRHRLFEERFVCIMDASRPGEVEDLTLEAFADMPHALFSATGGDSNPGVIDTMLSRHGLKRRIAVTLAHVAAVPFTVAGTDLVATVAERVAGLLCAGTSISIQATPFEVPPFAVDLLQTRKSVEEPGMRWFVNAIDRALQAATPENPFERTRRGHGLSIEAASLTGPKGRFSR